MRKSQPNTYRPKDRGHRHPEQQRRSHERKTVHRQFVRAQHLAEARKAPGPARPNRDLELEKEIVATLEAPTEDPEVVIR